MASTVILLLQISLISLQCGLKHGVAGNLLLLLHNAKFCIHQTIKIVFIDFLYFTMSVSQEFCLAYVCSSTILTKIVVMGAKCDHFFSLSYGYRFTEFGGTVHHRPVEDLAFAVARFIQKGGSFINYYMVRPYISEY